MITVDINDKPIQVRFYHDSEAKITECLLIDKSSDKEFPLNVVSVSQAMCSAKDQFRRSVGRKVALYRAISYLDKPQRKAIWQAYFNKLGKFS